MTVAQVLGGCSCVVPPSSTSKTAVVTSTSRVGTVVTRRTSTITTSISRSVATITYKAGTLNRETSIAKSTERSTKLSETPKESTRLTTDSSRTTSTRRPTTTTSTSTTTTTNLSATSTPIANNVPFVLQASLYNSTLNGKYLTLNQVIPQQDSQTNFVTNIRGGAVFTWNASTGVITEATMNPGLTASYYSVKNIAMWASPGISTEFHAHALFCNISSQDGLVSNCVNGTGYALSPWVLSSGNTNSLFWLGGNSTGAGAAEAPGSKQISLYARAAPKASCPDSIPSSSAAPFAIRLSSSNATLDGKYISLVNISNVDTDYARSLVSTAAAAAHFTVNATSKRLVEYNGNAGFAAYTFSSIGTPAAWRMQDMIKGFNYLYCAVSSGDGSLTCTDPRCADLRAGWLSGGLEWYASDAIVFASGWVDVKMYAEFV
ncbi:hypothetical protein ANO11243_092030 [Dothideomycetidae sp. 11243]|nr:hypothetical protein ANO11243_092030 [fungal sp. No.11243]